MHRIGALALLLLLLPLTIRGQFPNWDAPGALRDTVTDKNIYSVSIAPASWPLAAPIIGLGRLDRLRLSFDYMGFSPGGMRYRFIHCDRNWQPSNLLVSDYVEGYPINRLDNYSPSVGISPGYTHYELIFPNRDARLKISGNYVIQILHPYIDTIVLVQRQFAVTEDAIRGELTTRSCSDDDFIESTAIEVKYTAQTVASTPDQLAVYSKQNWYDPRYITLRHEPLGQRNSWAYGSHFTLKRNGIWNNGAEWRILDIRSLAMPGEGVSRIQRMEGAYHVEATIDTPNDKWTAPEKPDLNSYWAYGRDNTPSGAPFEPNRKDDAQVTSDYVYVYFTLKMDANDIFNSYEGIPILFIPGATGLERGVQMSYSATREQYEATVLLKQGVYNYRYALLQADGLAFFPIEKSYQQTQNEFHILCYFQGIGDRADRLISHLVYGQNEEQRQQKQQAGQEDRFRARAANAR